jgi:hypothetical protein
MLVWVATRSREEKATRCERERVARIPLYTRDPVEERDGLRVFDSATEIKNTHVLDIRAVSVNCCLCSLVAMGRCTAGSSIINPVNMDRIAIFKTVREPTI